MPGLLARISDAFAVAVGRKASSAPPYVAGGMGGMGFALDTFGKNRAPTPIELVRENLGTAYSCASLNADLIASTPLKLYVKTRSGEGKSRLSKSGRTKQLSDRQKERLSRKTSNMMLDAQDVEVVTDHPVLTLLSGSQLSEDGVGVNLFWLFEVTQLYMEVVGRAYWYAEKNGIGGIPSALWVLPPQHVREQPGTDGKIIDSYQFTGTVQTKTYAIDEIIPFRMVDLLNPYMGGMSPLRACFEQVKLSRSVDALASAQIQNGARPSAIYSPKGDSEGGGIGAAEAKRLQSALKQQFAMSGAGGVMVAEYPGTLSTLTWPINDIIDATRYGLTKIQIANAFRVPTTKLDRNDANLASARTGDYAHAKDAGVPRCKRNEAAINHFLIPMYGPEAQERLFFAYDDPPGLVDEDTLADKWKTVAQYALSRNELRDEIGLPPVPWGDQPLAPNNVVAVDPETGVPEPPAMSPAFGNLNINAGGDQPTEAPTTAPHTGQQLQTAQDTVLNGAQVTAATAIVVAVVAGEIPRDAGIGQLIVLFNLSNAQAEQIMGSAGKPNVPTTPNPKPQDANEQATQEQADQAGQAPNDESGSQGGSGGAGDAGGAAKLLQVSGSVQQKSRRIGNIAPNGLAGPLPQGEKIAAILRKMFQEQRARISETLAGKTKADQPQTLPDHFTPLSEWNETIANEVKPVIELILTDAGKNLIARVGASPEVEAVFEKNIPKAAEELALKFVESTNATTSMQLDEALSKLRGEISEGLTQGDTRVDMRKRVQEIFDQADQQRAETIARTEASRAQHQGELMGAKESKVVRTKAWLASADACDNCTAFAAMGDIPLDKSFGEDSYGVIDAPPGHPRCQCSLSYQVQDEPQEEV